MSYLQLSGTHNVEEWDNVDMDAFNNFMPPCHLPCGCTGPVHSETRCSNPECMDPVCDQCCIASWGGGAVCRRCHQAEKRVFDLQATLFPERGYRALPMVRLECGCTGWKSQLQHAWDYHKIQMQCRKCHQFFCSSCPSQHGMKVKIPMCYSCLLQDTTLTAVPDPPSPVLEGADSLHLPLPLPPPLPLPRPPITPPGGAENQVPFPPGYKRRKLL